LNLASALMKLNKKVISLDADIKMSGLSLQLGMYHFPVTLNDVIKHGTNILDALYIHSHGLRIIPASLYAQNVSISKLDKHLNNPAFKDNIIMIDSPPGLDPNAMQIPKICDEIILVTIPEIPSVVNLLKNINEAHKRNCKIRGIIVNRYRKKCKEQIRPDEIESVCGIPILGVIPEDKNITKSIFRRIPAYFLDSYSSSSIEFDKIAASIAGVQYVKPKNLTLKRMIRRLRI
ncbi:MAG: P-loop NTPase, partial [Nanoarchaeota archaeon]|nr:P-loop NTPase [Nanoarchaeota archaeon]